MTVVGREGIDHPALGTAGGSALHALIETIYTNIANDNPGRYAAYSSIANSTLAQITHGFGAAFDQYKVIIYTGTYPALTRVTDPAGSGWTIAATSGSLKTKIDVTTPSSGGPWTFVVLVLHVPSDTAGATPTVAGVVKSYAADPSVKVKTLSSAGYTILDTDGYDTVLVSTGASDRTIVLPAAATNTGRNITVKKTDNGAGKVIVDGASAETIDGSTTTELNSQYVFVQLVCDGTSWSIIG